MKLIKNNKIVKFPRSGRHVKSIAKDALIKADRQEWKRILIIGEGNTSGSWYSSGMSDNELVGLLERVKNDILNS